MTWHFFWVRFYFYLWGRRCSNLAIKYLNFDWICSVLAINTLKWSWCCPFDVFISSLEFHSYIGKNLIVVSFDHELASKVCHVSLDISRLKWLDVFLYQEIRNRHWLQVMHVTKKSFQLEANIFKLKHILDIGLTQWVAFILRSILFSWRIRIVFMKDKTT